MAHSEYLFVPSGPRDSCLVCRATPEVLIDSLQQGTVELCIPHLLAASRHLSGESYEETHQRAAPLRPHA